MIYIGSDHRGFELKAKINQWLSGRGYEFEDLGSFAYDHDDDYVDYAVLVGQAVSKHPERHWGIVICGSGVGVDIAANKINDIRCGLGFASDQIHAARKDDNINCLALPADNIEDAKALEIVEAFLETEFDNSDRYLKRIEKISRYEDTNTRH